MGMKNDNVCFLKPKPLSLHQPVTIMNTNSTDSPTGAISPAIADKGRRRLLGPDIVRALAIVLVVLQHTLPSAMHTDSGSVADLFLAPNAVLFLMISGALLLPLSEPAGTFFRKRAVRVLTPFIFWSMIYAWDNWVTYGDGNTYWLAMQIRWSMLDPTFSAGYFIPVIIGLYLIYPVLSPWIRTASKRAMQWFIGVWCVALTLPYLTVVMGVDNYQFTLIGTFYNYIGFAVAGCYFMRYPLSKERRTKAIAMIAVAITLAYILPLLLSHSLFTLDISSQNLSLPVAMAAMLLFALFSPLKRPDNAGAVARTGMNVIGVIARYSYVIYLIHPLAVRLLTRHYPDLDSSVLLFPIAFLISLLTGYIISHTPCLRHFLS